MKRPRGPDRDKLLRELQAEVPHARHAWELGRMRRRLEADLKTIVERSVRSYVVPLRAGDPRVAHAQLDRQLQAKLRELGHFDADGLIYGGETRSVCRPFHDETVNALREVRHVVDHAFLNAKFTSPLEHAAFAHAPKQAPEDREASTEDQWQEAWLQLTAGYYPKAVACEAIGINEHASDERRRRPRARAGGLSINDSELLERLQQMIADETKKLDDQRVGRAYSIEVAKQRGLKLPKDLRLQPVFSRTTVAQLHADCRFYNEERLYWKARLARQPRASHQLWRKLIRLREDRLAGIVATFAIHAWIEQHTQRTTGTTS
jgi:hypothetical protein